MNPHQQDNNIRENYCFFCGTHGKHNDSRYCTNCGYQIGDYPAEFQLVIDQALARYKQEVIAALPIKIMYENQEPESSDLAWAHGYNNAIDACKAAIEGVSHG